MIHVWWYDGRCCWDQDIIDVIAPAPHYQHWSRIIPAELRDGSIEGVVVVIPARYFVNDVGLINHAISHLKWVVVMLTSDEESLFPWRELQHPNMRIWIQSGRPDIHNSPDLRFFPVGAPDMSLVHDLPADREQNVPCFFSGQITHARRDQMWAAMKAFPLHLTTGFTKGFPRGEYLRRLVSAKVAPAPSGPASADTFRCWEALECGVVPICDEGPIKDGLSRSKADYPLRFWNVLLGEDPFVPVVINWAAGPTVAQMALNDYPHLHNLTFSAYQQYKRQLRQRLAEDCAELAGLPFYYGDITVLIPTSCTPNNPDDSHLEAVYNAIREQLPDSEILIMFDQPHEKLAHRNADYQEYIRRVLWRCNHEWSNVVPIVYNEFLHQSEKVRRTLPFVRTPLILFNEHDTPLQGDIDWSRLKDPLIGDALDLIRFYHEVQIHPEHQHLMFERVSPDLVKTIQWSGRPHLARTDYYRSLMRYFSTDERIFIEWRMHGVAQSEGWDAHRMCLYAPEAADTIQHSGHLDARGNDPTFEEELTR